MAVSELTPASASRLERKRAKNRDALIAAARRLFARHGVEATTIAAIAEAADLGFGTFYRYFPDKEAVLHAVLDVGRAEINAVLTHPENDTAPPPAALRSLTARFVRAVRRNYDVLTLMWRVGVQAEAIGARRTRSARPRDRSLPVLLAATIRRIVERGIAMGDFAAGDPALVARFIASAHMYLLSRTSIELGEQPLIDEFCAFELRALGVPPPAAGGGDVDNAQS